MTEEEWHTSREPLRLLMCARQTASPRRLQLAAAAFSRWLGTQPPYALARPLADFTEKLADSPMSRDEVYERQWDVPGDTFSLGHALGPAESVGARLSQMIFYARCRAEQGEMEPAAVDAVAESVVREVFGNPFRPVSVSPAWRTPNVLALARTAYDHRAFDTLPVLADALEDTGCDAADLLAHLRSCGPHVRGCWALDLVLGKG